MEEPEDESDVKGEEPDLELVNDDEIEKLEVSRCLILSTAHSLLTLLQEPPQGTKREEESSQAGPPEEKGQN